MNHFNIHIQRYEVDSDIILADISTVINTTDRIALVGPNGVGKSTFLKILSGQIREYIGGIDNTGGISIGYLEQIHFLDEARTVRDDIADAYTDIRDIEARIRTEEANLENGEYEAYTELLEKYKYIGGYTYMNEVEKVARGIGIYDLLEKTLAQVSGGERTKIALCKTLLSRPDFLLLDEPTNFIDLK
jgi:ATP-binding cassette subfamily F protein 3